MTGIAHSIKTDKDIEFFLEHTNSLHDAYLVGVEFSHKGHTGRNPHYVDQRLSQLRLRYLVTSIKSTVVELEFSALQEWQIKDNSYEITDCSLSFDEKGNILWADDCSTAVEIRAGGSYVIAESMKWHFI